jgi:hypothetical protein
MEIPPAAAAADFRNVRRLATFDFVSDASRFILRSFQGFFVFGFCRLG